MVQTIVFFRLAASEADRMNDAEESDEDSLDDVDAATAMLELKHGQRQHHEKQYRKKPPMAEVNKKLFIWTSLLKSLFRRS